MNLANNNTTNNPSEALLRSNMWTGAAFALVLILLALFAEGNFHPGSCRPLVVAPLLIDLEPAFTCCQAAGSNTNIIAQP